jgi:hypothetical protein
MKRNARLYMLVVTKTEKNESRSEARLDLNEPWILFSKNSMASCSQRPGVICCLASSYFLNAVSDLAVWSMISWGVLNVVSPVPHNQFE